MAKRDKQPATPPALDDFLTPEKGDVKKGVDSLLEAKPETVQQENRDAQDCQVRIAAIYTQGSSGPQTVFRMYEDALILTIRIRTNPCPRVVEANFDANFQILDYATNDVLANNWRRDLTLSWGSEFSLHQGDSSENPTASTPPAAWGLRTGLYTFRALIEVPALRMLCWPDRTILFRVR